MASAIPPEEEAAMRDLRELADRWIATLPSDSALRGTFSFSGRGSTGSSTQGGATDAHLRLVVDDEEQVRILPGASHRLNSPPPATGRRRAGNPPPEPSQLDTVLQALPAKPL